MTYKCIPAADMPGIELVADDPAIARYAPFAVREEEGGCVLGVELNDGTKCCTMGWEDGEGGVQCYAPEDDLDYAAIAEL